LVFISRSTQTAFARQTACAFCHSAQHGGPGRLCLPNHAIHEFAVRGLKVNPSLHVFPGLCLTGGHRAESGTEIGETLAAVPGHPSVRREFGGAIDRKFGKARVKPNSESEALGSIDFEPGTGQFLATFIWNACNKAKEGTGP
jgi:hypothetical protein